MATRTRAKRKEAAQNRLEAMRNPLRAEILVLLMKGPNSPSKMARILGEKTANVSYHAKRLAELGVAELAETRPVRGSVEHVYKATERYLVDTEEWDELPAELKDHHRLEFAQAIVDDLALGVRAKTMGSDKHFHCTQTPVVVDEAGRAELMEIYERARLEVLEAQDRSTERLAEGGGEGVSMSSCLACFEIPPNR